jgi:hypothetical protein
MVFENDTAPGSPAPAGAPTASSNFQTSRPAGTRVVRPSMVDLFTGGGEAGGTDAEPGSGGEKTR